MFSDAPSQGWGLDLAATLLARFGIEVTFTSCFVTAESLSFEEGYNAAVAAYVDGVWGAGALKTAFAEVERRRVDSYNAHFTANPGDL